LQGTVKYKGGVAYKGMVSLITFHVNPLFRKVLWDRHIDMAMPYSW